MKTYDPSEVSVIVGGSIIEGGVKGEFVSIARDNDAFSYIENVNGSGTRSKNPSRAGKITVRIQASSESNAYLSGLGITDELNNGAIVPILIRDNSGLDSHTGESCYLIKQPDTAYADEVGEREYIFQVEDLKMFLGGN